MPAFSSCWYWKGGYAEDVVDFAAPAPDSRAAVASGGETDTVSGSSFREIRVAELLRRGHLQGLPLATETLTAGQRDLVLVAQVAKSI